MFYFYVSFGNVQEIHKDTSFVNTYFVCFNFMWAAVSMKIHLLCLIIIFFFCFIIQYGIAHPSSPSQVFQGGRLQHLIMITINSFSQPSRPFPIIFKYCCLHTARFIWMSIPNWWSVYMVCPYLHSPVCLVFLACTLKSLNKSLISSQIR